MPTTATDTDENIKITNTVTFGLSKNLSIPVSLKLCYLQAAPGTQPGVVRSSEKYRNPECFQKLSLISANSDLYVVLEVFDGNDNLVVEPVQSSYKAFANNRRVWDTYMKLGVNFNQMDYGAYLRFTVMEIVSTEPVVFGLGTLSLFNHKDGLLRKGSYKVAVDTLQTPELGSVIYGDLNNMTEAESNLVKYENGQFTRNEWLDAMALPMVEKARQAELAASSLRAQLLLLLPSASHYLYVELPNFLLPIVYLDETYPLTVVVPLISFAVDKPGIDARAANEGAMIVNSIDIPTVPLPKLYDPDFHNALLTRYNASQEESLPSAAGLSALGTSGVDPIERKFQKLATNINNNSVLDKEVKPSPHMRDELVKILNMPSSALLSDHEKKILWKFRYFFSKGSLSDELGNTSAPLTSTRQYLVKFLKSFNWENEYELDHAFTEIVPLWTVDSIDIGDALELLSNNFNPQTLTMSLRRRIIDTTNSNVKDINTSEEKKIEKIFRYAKRLRSFAVDRLRMASADELLLYLLQLVQALKNEPLLAKGDPLAEAPLARFLIEKSVQSNQLGNFFYWYVKVENEDQLNSTTGGAVPAKPNDGSIYNVVLNLYIEKLKDSSSKTKSNSYKYLKRQIHFIKQLTKLVELLRSTFRKNEATSRKKQFLQDYLADGSHDLLKFDPFPLPLDPSIIICGCYPSECSVFKSSLSPLKITFKTIINHHQGSTSGSMIFGGKKHKYGKYALMFKIGDDLRQDQLVIQIITLMDQLLKNENLNLKLTPYKILATSPIAGLIQFVPNDTLDSVLSKSYAENGVNVFKRAALPIDSAEPIANGILSFLQFHSHVPQQEDSGSEIYSYEDPQRNPHAIATDLGVSPVLMDNYVKSCAGYCVITYLLGVGDRHLDNLLLSPNGKFWHADFGYILGRDPKPFPPLMKLPIQVIDGMGGMNHENFNIFKSYCFITYTTLRRNSNLILNLFQLMLNANIPDIQIDPKRAVSKVQDKFALEMSEEEAILHFQNLIIDSVHAFLPVVIDTLHSLAQYWRA
ncbi:hypothetical protein PUMCH_001405 [Australozyma saopauloensis]|uniref:Phosphatidylinositol 3-kinase VPS34 n=1 Tax=Australozyma saopauloensis TaxID=291208 RepID=A0AAX4H6E9_9ASCO|nr:hypothetical protein PUMCH_001405 [[Candida] saopauloensis]